MKKLPSVLLIGGAVRNVGKTTLVSKIIKKFSSENDIIAVKIKTIYEKDIFFHGTDKNPLKSEEKYRIFEEINKTGEEDTSKMLNSGAKRVFKIKTKRRFAENAFNEVMNKIDYSSMIICESNSIRHALKPGLFLLIKNENSNNIKPSASELQKYADKIILTDGKKHNFNIENLKIENNCWKLI